MDGVRFIATKWHVDLVQYRNPWPQAKARVQRLCRVNDSLLQLLLRCPHNTEEGVSNESLSKVITNDIVRLHRKILGVCLKEINENRH